MGIYLPVLLRRVVVVLLMSWQWWRRRRKLSRSKLRLMLLLWLLLLRGFKLLIRLVENIIPKHELTSRRGRGRRRRRRRTRRRGEIEQGGEWHLNLIRYLLTWAAVDRAAEKLGEYRYGRVAGRARARARTADVEVDDHFLHKLNRHADRAARLAQHVRHAQCARLARTYRVAALTLFGQILHTLGRYYDRENLT